MNSKTSDKGSSAHIGKESTLDALQSTVEDAWRRCKKLWPSEAAAIETVYKFLAPNILCGLCGGQQFKHSYGARKVTCSGCRHSFSFTRKTFFHGVRKFRPWLFAIYFRQQKVPISTAQFKNLAGIAYSTAWNIANKLMHVMTHNLPDNTMPVHSSMFDSMITKRSRETPARLHPREEQNDPNTDALTAPMVRHSGPENICDEPAQDISEEDRKILELLGKDAIHFDSLSKGTDIPIGQLLGRLTLLEISHLVVRSGDWYAIAFPEKRSTAWELTRKELGNQLSEEQLLAQIKTFNESIGKTFRGISRKFLQYYLAAHGFEASLNGSQSDTLLAACLKYGQIRDKEALEYVTPTIVRLCSNPFVEKDRSSATAHTEFAQS
jgi:DprA winged helix domain